MPMPANPQIFIIDDDWDDREFIIDALQRQGVPDNFTEFENGKELSDFLSSNPATQPDLILLDLNMPVKNGYDTLEALKNDDVLKKIPVVVLTASTTAEDQKTCFALGCDDFISKPMSVSGYADVARTLHDRFLPNTRS